LQAVADSLGDLAAPRLSGVLPVDADGHWQVLGLTADPGVLEINLPICHGWADYHGWMTLLEQACATVGLRSWKAAAGGRRECTGGGNHLLWGGPDLAHHPFFSRPAWLVGILRYWQHHPALAYLFSGPCVGPSSQAPRPDEAAGSIFDLELAYRAIEQADDGRSPDDPRGDHRSLIGETLRHLHADRSGNNHRCEISFDKFWNPGAPAGCLGLVEFRALETLPQVEWSSAIALLWSSLAAHLLEPAHRPRALRDWGSELHDRMLLPSQLWADLESILAELAAAGLVLDPAPYRQIWEWRVPPLLEWRQGGDWVVLRPAPEPWPLICDTPVQGGFTSRFIDGSLRRIEISVSDSFRQHGSLRLNGRPLPLSEAPLAVRYRHQRLYPCLHPAIAPQLPLALDLITPASHSRFQLAEQDLTFLPLQAGSEPQPTPGAAAWSGRQRPGDLTIDLRLD
ncbi:MAG: transglutaminase family protein, partial [Synechococcaceae cyanobacterium ELA182]